MFSRTLLNGTQYTLQLEEQVTEDGILQYDLHLCTKEDGSRIKNDFVDCLKREYEIKGFAINEKYQLTGELLAEQKGNLYLLLPEMINDEIFFKNKTYVCAMSRDWDFRDHYIYSLLNGIKIISDFEEGNYIYYTIKEGQVFKNSLDVHLTILTTVHKENQVLQIIKTNEGIDADDKSFYWDNSKEDLSHLKDDTIYVGVLDETLDLKKLKKIMQVPSPQAIAYAYGRKTDRKVVFYIYERDLTIKNRVVRYIQPVEYDYMDDVIQYGKKELEVAK